MGTRGPAPTPTEILKLRGSRRADDRGEGPRLPAGELECPVWLDEEAKSKWRSLTPQLSAAGLLTVVDGDALAAYCVAWSELRTATETLQREGRVFRTESGYLSPHPAATQQRGALQAVKAFAALLGLNPFSRVGLSVPPEPVQGVSSFARKREAVPLAEPAQDKGHFFRVGS